MYSILMIVVVLIIARVLFKKFGYISEEEVKKKEEAIKYFLKLHGGNYSKSVGLSEYSGGNLCNVIMANEEEIAEMKSKKGEKIFIFDDKVFLKSLEKIIVNFIELFSQMKLDRMKEYCDPELFQSLEKNVQELSKNEKSLKISIISFKEKMIVEKNVNATNGRVLAKVITEQINYIEDKDSNVISGYKNKIQTVSELWEFVSVNMKNNKWVISSIRECK